MNPKLIDIAKEYSKIHKIESIEALGHGLINDTYLVTEKNPGLKYVLQRINKMVFHHPDILMRNFLHITYHLCSVYPDPVYKTLSIKRTRNDLPFYVDKNDDTWRAMLFLENSRTLSSITNEKIAYQFAKVYGNFLKRLSTLNPNIIEDTIPNFHNYDYRVVKFQKALDVDFQGRSQLCAEEISKLKKRFHYIEDFKSLQLPDRILHSDTKIDNVLFDQQGDNALMVIDLDISMKGPLLYDYGDMVRSCTNSCREDDTNLDKISIKTDILKALTKGFIEETGNIMEDKEGTTLYLGPLLITYIQAIRNLTDYLDGDVYYKIDYPEHNLIRARNQIRLLEKLEEKKSYLMETVNSFLK